jgi:hypothetical protein
MRYFKLALLLALLPVITFAGSSFNLNIFTDNGEGSQSSQVQYTMYAEDTGTDFIRLRFSNESSLYSVIESIYFTEAYTILVDDLNQDDFTVDVKPRTMPAGVDLDPDFVTAASVSANPPPALNGIKPGESIVLHVKTGDDYEQFINSIETGSSRVGIHVISFPDGTSESATIQVVPEADSIALFFTGLASLWYTRKLKAKHEKVKAA